MNFLDCVSLDFASLECISLLDNTEEVVAKLDEMPGVFLSGSRCYLPLEVTTSTDYDFIAEDSPEMHKNLVAMGMLSPSEGREPYYDVSVSAIYYGESVQVVLKKPEYWDASLAMINLFKENPNMYRKYFWKSNPIAWKHLDFLDPPTGKSYVVREIIRNRINALFQMLMA